jgi:hypothetical protein
VAAVNLRAVLRFAVKERLLSASPFAALDAEDRPAPDETPHKPHEWTDEEIEALLAASAARAAANGRRFDRQIADAMGHKKTATTEIYISRFNGELADERIREAMTG